VDHQMGSRVRAMLVKSWLPSLPNDC
jgi:hypothetical protein